jgi:hypothetical protein
MVKVNKKAVKRVRIHEEDLSAKCRKAYDEEKKKCHKGGCAQQKGLSKCKCMESSCACLQNAMTKYEKCHGGHK